MSGDVNREMNRTEIWNKTIFFSKQFKTFFILMKLNHHQCFGSWAICYKFCGDPFKFVSNHRWDLKFSRYDLQADRNILSDVEHCRPKGRVFANFPHHLSPKNGCFHWFSRVSPTVAFEELEISYRKPLFSNPIEIWRFCRKPGQKIRWRKNFELSHIQIWAFVLSKYRDRIWIVDEKVMNKSQCQEKFSQSKNEILQVRF